MVRMIKKQREQRSVRILKLNDYKDCLLNNETVLKSKQSDKIQRL